MMICINADLRATAEVIIASIAAHDLHFVMACVILKIGAAFWQILHGLLGAEVAKFDCGLEIATGRAARSGRFHPSVETL